MQELQEIEGVEVTGFVPDVRTYLAKAHVAVAPFSIAAGIQNKILEAMAYGLPVVATSRTAQGLSAGVADMVDTARYRQRRWPQGSSYCYGMLGAGAPQGHGRQAAGSGRLQLGRNRSTGCCNCWRIHRSPKRFPDQRSALSHWPDCQASCWKSNCL